MKASVIITTYKRADFLRRAVESVLHQSVFCEIIVADDNGKGSADQVETEKSLHEFRSRIHYLPLEENSGACIARNFGVDAALGDYLFFLDDDDEFLPKKVQTQTKFLDENPQFDGCLSAFTRIGDDGMEISSESNYPAVGSFKDFVQSGNFFTPMLAIRKTSFLKSGGFRTIARFQDRYFMMHCLLQGMQFADLRHPLYIMYEHSGERVTHNNVEKSIMSLNMIKEFVDHNLHNFKDDEYQRFLQKDYRMRATVYYVSKEYRLAAAVFWLKTWNRSKRMKDLMMVVKSFLK